MSQRALICVMILFCLKVASVSAQAPTLDPSQTVNPATGEMGFALPLGVVRGVNGHDFPLMLNYHAGIRTVEEASCVGLGFGIGPGGITRSTVFMPDENEGDGNSYTQGSPGEPNCDFPGWLEILSIIITLATMILAAIVSIYSGGTASAPAWVGAVKAGSFLLSAGGVVAPLIYYSSLDFHVGGSHIPTYNYVRGKGGGFFKGSTEDLPDNYFLNTPFLSGQLVWVGDYQNGHFVLKNVQGASVKGKSTVNITYTLNAVTNEKKFEVQLPDGTRLIFDKTVKAAAYSSSSIYQEANGTECYGEFETFQKQKAIQQWLLTKIIYPDYVDGSSPPDANPTALS